MIAKKDNFILCLANIFYSVIMADGKAEVEELNKTIRISERLWLQYEQDDIRLQEEDLRSMFKQIKVLYNQKADSHSILKDVKSILESNAGLFNNESKLLILKSAHAIAASFARKNKAELIVLNQISEILK